VTRRQIGLDQPDEQSRAAEPMERGSRVWLDFNWAYRQFRAAFRAFFLIKD
jgi:hypothetical protein